MARDPIRLLRPDGELEPGCESAPLTLDEAVSLYRVMLFNRRFDERMVTLQRQGRIGFYVGSAGEEAAIIGSAYPLTPQDWIFPCYRELGAALVRGIPLDDLLCQLFGNAGDPAKGRQMPNHYGSPALRYASVSSPVGTQLPQAVGVGMAVRMRGGSEVALVYFGDGATSEGDFHVAMNFAGVYKAPVIFLCRNNQWAISTPIASQTASEDLAVKASAYGIKGIRVDGNDLFAVCAVVRRAADQARAGGGPTLIEATTYRLGSHSTSDDPTVYREEEAVEAWRRLDPLTRLRLYLSAQGRWDDVQEAALEEGIRREIQEALRRVERIGPPAPETLFDDVYEELPWNLREQREELLRLL